MFSAFDFSRNNLFELLNTKIRLFPKFSLCLPYRQNCIFKAGFSTPPKPLSLKLRNTILNVLLLNYLKLDAFPQFYIFAKGT